MMAFYVNVYCCLRPSVFGADVYKPKPEKKLAGSYILLKTKIKTTV